VSGHGSQEELRLMINLVRPKFFIPVHGDFRHLQRHARLAMDIGISENAYLLEDGDVLELDQKTAVKNGKVAAGRVLLDSGASGNVVEDMIIRDRRHLSEDGLVIAIITINKLTGRVEGVPEFVTRGFVAGDLELGEQAKGIVGRTLEESSAEERADQVLIKEKIRVDLKRYIQRQTASRPFIMPIILEI
jgi:ribonuclease J